MASTSYDKHIYSSDSENDDFECPLCLEELDISDKNFRPCPCGYQICRFCWNNIIENYGGRCPACRREYDKQNVQFTPLSEEELKRLKAESKRKKQKRKQGETGRQHLANVRVVQRNLVYVSGLTPKMAVEETLRQPEYFGQFGRIIKVVINRKPATGKPGVSGEVISVYVTYSKKEDAAKAIAAVDGSICDGRLLRASNGTTKYCTYYLRNQVCQNPNCMYLHEPGEDADSLLKDELGHLTSGCVFINGLVPGDILQTDANV
ncbi:RING/Ubox like zinc-binding domain-containing protein [Paraphysoderma sedebokerense]|nr:RING/Ubox like zinc-binding domain-containing protein [Paraphysoderma sedebokerense]